MFFQKTRHTCGFTLTEIMTTIIIVGLLASLALPRFTGTFERMRAAEGVQILTALLGAQRAFEQENGSYANSLADLDVEFDHAAYFNLPPNVYIPAAAGDPVADITRTGSYTLDIDEDGNINCTNGGAGFTCTQAGY